MKIIGTKDYEELSAQAAACVIDQIHKKPDSVLVLATGNTPLGMFAHLTAAFRSGAVSFKSCSLIELDDYWNIPLDDHRNLFNWLSAEFIEHVDFPFENIIRFNTGSSDPEEECRRVENALPGFGGIDLVVLGLGTNGHVGFNEPGSDIDATTRVIELSPESITSSANYWGSEKDVPRFGITLGLGTLLAAKKTLLLVSGKHKAQIFKKAINEPATPAIPASFLQKQPDLTVIVDQDTLGGLYSGCKKSLSPLIR